MHLRHSESGYSMSKLDSLGRLAKNGSACIIPPFGESPEILAYGPLAQLVEQLTFNQLVDGSNPSRPTISPLLNAPFSLLSVKDVPSNLDSL